MLRWKVWLAGGGTFSDEPGTDPGNAHGSWLEVPTFGALIVSIRDLEDPPLFGRWWSHGATYYLHRPELGWTYPVHADDLRAVLATWGIEAPTPWPRPEDVPAFLDSVGVLPFVKLGASVSTDEWSATVRAAHLDPDIPPGSCPLRRRTDRRPGV